jgi:hypothetical protein
MSHNRSQEQEAAYTVGWNLAEMGHAVKPDIFMGQPDLRAAFEEGWADGAEWSKEHKALAAAVKASGA